MVDDSDYLNILNYGRPQGTIDLRPYPDEVLDVDPQIIASMRARLRGEDYSNGYDARDRAVDEVALAREKRKLERVFGNAQQVCEAFSSVKNIALIQEELKFEEVDRELLRDYSYIRSHEQNVDEVDFLNHFLFGERLRTKKEREVPSEVFRGLIKEYQTKHFDILKISKELIEIESDLLRLFKERKLVGLFDELLSEFYGKKA